MVLTNEFVDGEQKGGSSGVYNRERERENRAEQNAVGAKMMVATVVGLSEGRLVGSTFAQPPVLRTTSRGGGATACGRRPKGRVQRPVIVETTYLIRA
jgi:hypothetical protein